MMQVTYISEPMNGSAVLAHGEGAVLFDPGMAWFADKTVAAIRDILGDQPLDAIFLSHAHYDHVAALPVIRKYWPEAKVYAGAYAFGILSKPSARATMRKLSEAAASVNHGCLPEDYNEDLICADEIMEDGQVFCFKDIRIRAIETIGHTRDSFTFVVGDDYMIGSETFGLIYAEGTYMPLYLISYEKARASLEKVRHIPIRHYLLIHSRVIDDPVAYGLWDKIEAGMERSRDIISRIIREETDQEARLLRMEEHFWKLKGRKIPPPREAFRLNATALLKTIEKEM